MQKLLDGVLQYLPNPSEVSNYALDESSGYLFYFFFIKIFWQKFIKKVFNRETVRVPINPERSNKNKFLGLAFKLEVNINLN